MDKNLTLKNLKEYIGQEWEEIDSNDLICCFDTTEEVIISDPYITLTDGNKEMLMYENTEDSVQFAFIIDTDGILTDVYVL